MPRPKILISAGEDSGDRYAAELALAIRRRNSGADLFGCTGPRMRRAGVRQVVDAASLSVVGIVEVLHHIPRIYGEFRKLVASVKRERPDVAVLTDSPSFHLRLARKLHRMGIPVVYFVAPQVWAWKKWRVRQIRRDVARLLCIFPFEEEFFRRQGIDAAYIGHPLAGLIRPAVAREEFCARNGIAPDRPMVALLPGSRAGESARHLPYVAEAVDRLSRNRELAFVLATPVPRPPSFWEPISRSPIQIVEGQAWEAIAHAELALAASGTVTVEAALLGTPMVTFYKVTPLTWWLGRSFVRVPHYSMVNLIAGRRIVPELIQNDLTGARLAREAAVLLDNSRQRETMRRDLREVRQKLSGEAAPIETAANVVQGFINKEHA